jgi:CRP-like cAMP-binding protein
MTHREMLKTIDMFAELTDEELAAAENCIEEVPAEAGETIVEEGVPGERLYMIQSGRVRVLRTVEQREVDIAELGPGKVFGEMSLLDDSPASATVRALESCRFLVIGRLDLNVLLNWDTILAAKLWRSFARMLSRRLRDTNESIVRRLVSTSAEDEQTLAVSREVLARSEGGAVES